MANAELRVHELKVGLYKPLVHLDIRKYFFSVRIVDYIWNSLYQLHYYVTTLSIF